jgi:hypothetical protein
MSAEMKMTEKYTADNGNQRIICINLSSVKPAVSERQMKSLVSDENN